MNKRELKERVCEIIEAHKDEIIALGEDIFAHPELAYQEIRTASKVEEKLAEMGLEYQKGLAVTGLKARMKGASSQATVAVLGEMDALICRDHPDADPVTGAAHCCGHSAQIASMLGAGMGLLYAGAMPLLGGDVVLMAVPAEEGQGDYIRELTRSGRIALPGGKQQLIVEGAFDDVDMAMMVHTGPMGESIMHGGGAGDVFKMGVGGSHVGSLRKYVQFVGKEAHPGIAPHEGINALNAANLALTCINTNRETFRDEDAVRVHSVITDGGRAGVVPADVRMDVYVRARNVRALVDAGQKVERSLQAGALAVGGQVHVETMPGYLPRITDPGMDRVFRVNAEELVGKDAVGVQKDVAGCTDMGDVSQLMPAIHQRSGGVQGRIHEADYRIVDKELAYVVPAKAMAMTVVDLLWGDASVALEIKRNYRPACNKDTYLKTWQEILNSKLA